METEETSESSHKRAKLCDLELFGSSRGIEGSNTGHPVVDSLFGALDLNVNSGLLVGVDAPACIEEDKKLLISEKEAKNRGFDLNVDAEDISSSVNGAFYPCKNQEDMKSRDDWECGSSVGLLDKKDLMRAWEGLKQINYMPTNRAVPIAIPKSCWRKRNNHDMMRKKIKKAKTEQGDQFAKVAVPSGLLNGLNPGIINHVRNRGQVHSIIEALVRSEKTEHRLFESKQGSQMKNRMGVPSGTDGLGVNRCGLSHGGVLLERRQIERHASLVESSNLKSEFIRRDDNSYVGEKREFERMHSRYNLENKDDGLALKLSSSVTAASENKSCLTNDSAKLSSVTSLSVIAANVASWWLELLIQDIRGRLAALRCSKKRVRAVITTERPFMMSEDSYVTKGSTRCHFDNASVAAHAIRWSTLFGQMDKALSEEESHLETWLSQVNEMQLHCERGLYGSSLYHASQETATIGNNNRLGEVCGKDSAVRAAAASLYSTCNFLLSTENLLRCHLSSQ